MYELKKNGKFFTTKFVGTGPSSCKKVIYRAAVSRRLRNTGLSYGTTHYRITNKQTTVIIIIIIMNELFEDPFWGTRCHWVIGPRRFEAVCSFAT
jgi:hypothetical protein